MTSGMLATVKKAITGDTKDLVDPYVAVSFAGHRVRVMIGDLLKKRCDFESLILHCIHYIIQ